MVGIALLMAIPLGILSAVYINEYAPLTRLSSAVRFVAKLLTGIPSIICGVFAFAAVVMTTHRFSSLAGGVALAILILPTSRRFWGCLKHTGRLHSGLGQRLSRPS